MTLKNEEIQFLGLCPDLSVPSNLKLSLMRSMSVGFLVIDFFFVSFPPQVILLSLCPNRMASFPQWRTRETKIVDKSKRDLKKDIRKNSYLRKDIARTSKEVVFYTCCFALFDCICKVTLQCILSAYTYVIFFPFMLLVLIKY